MSKQEKIIAALILLLGFGFIIVTFCADLLLNKTESEPAKVSATPTATLTAEVTASPEIETTEEPTSEKENEAEGVLPEEDANLPSRSPVFLISEEDRELLARLLYLEAGGESWDEQCAVMSIVFNRYENGYWGKDFYSIIYAPRQFTPAPRIPYVTPNQMQYDVVDYICNNGVTIPYYILYFRAHHYHLDCDWNGKAPIPYCQVGNTYFSYFEKDK